MSLKLAVSGLCYTTEISIVPVSIAKIASHSTMETVTAESANSFV